MRAGKIDVHRRLLINNFFVGWPDVGIAGQNSVLSLGASNETCSARLVVELESVFTVGGFVVLLLFVVKVLLKPVKLLSVKKVMNSGITSDSLV
ncbi:uncharacterized protein BYT42DRAFT_590780 [Radiomyces spectabilis]|uniref:uncharacterized protein n=1 Tax=Radiomyces spectabilis TaxID=64574 RepID=UPI00221F3F6E|nr:uncharacterized protein BYT42DRAFT_590780 [Radiomyces spectabilis]KAI8364160.1 hypothetical protein BYT42DRAFT_590780 [Radiomyces spectabilis]